MHPGAGLPEWSIPLCHSETHDPTLAHPIPRRRCTRGGARTLPLVGRPARRVVQATCPPARERVHGTVDELRRTGRPECRHGGLASGPRLGARCARGHHAAECAAVPDHHGGDREGGLHRGQRQPTLHRARARAPAQGLRGTGHRDPGKLRAHTGRSDRPDLGGARGGRQPRRSARFLVRPVDHVCRAAPGQDGAGLQAAAHRPYQKPS